MTTTVTVTVRRKTMVRVRTVATLARMKTNLRR
jgi:hypothetical protein